jgi:hypothetical protein
MVCWSFVPHVAGVKEAEFNCLVISNKLSALRARSGMSHQAWIALDRGSVIKELMDSLFGLVTAKFILVQLRFHRARLVF